MEKSSVCSLAMDSFGFQPGFPLKYLIILAEYQCNESSEKVSRSPGRVTTEKTCPDRKIEH